MMTDLPLETSLPLQEPAKHLIIIMLGPGGDYDDRLLARAEALFGCKLTFGPVEFKDCAGVIYLGDEDAKIPKECADAMEFFYSRDKREFLVYRYRPYEKEFHLISRSWVHARV